MCRFPNDSENSRQGGFRPPRQVLNKIAAGNHTVSARCHGTPSCRMRAAGAPSKSSGPTRPGPSAQPYNSLPASGLPPSASAFPAGRASWREGERSPATLFHASALQIVLGLGTLEPMPWALDTVWRLFPRAGLLALRLAWPSARSRGQRLFALPQHQRPGSAGRRRMCRYVIAANRRAASEMARSNLAGPR